MKKLKYIIIFILIFISVNQVYAYTFDNTNKVYDYAQVLTDEQEDKLINKVKDYIDEYNIDMVIVTVKHYEQDTLKKYMESFYEANNFGLDYDKSGILIVIDLKENDIGIETFGKANSLYSESEIVKIKDSINKKNKYYDKLLSFIKLSNIYIEEDDTYNISKNTLNINLINILLASLIIPTIVIVLLLIKSKKQVNNKTINSYISANSLVINKKEDKFITTHTKQVNRNN